MSIKPTKFVQQLTPYVPGEQPKEKGFIKLNTNENPYPPAPAVIEVLKNTDFASLRLYPDPVCTKLRSILERIHNVRSDRIFIGNGSDEVLRLLFQAYLEPGDTLGITDPTYSLYPVLANIFGAKTETISLDENGDLPDIGDLSRFRVFAVANPNPPLGTFYAEEKLEAVISRNQNTLFIIDEAYVDFADTDSVSLMKKHSNVVISRTFSKSFSLAGVRLGYALASQEIIYNLFKIKDSYNINTLTQLVGCAALEAREYYRETANKIKLDRDFLAGELRKMNFKVYDSKGNFVFAERNDAATLFRELKKKKILVRYFDVPRLKNGLRITIGTTEELETLLQAIRELS